MFQQTLCLFTTFNVIAPTSNLKKQSICIEEHGGGNHFMFGGKQLLSFALRCVALGWVGLDWVGLGWVGLNNSCCFITKRCTIARRVVTNYYKLVNVLLSNLQFAI